MIRVTENDIYEVANGSARNVGTYTAVVTKLGHELKDVAEVAATCTTAGKKSGKECTRCDYTEGFEVIAANFGI